MDQNSTSVSKSSISPNYRRYQSLVSCDNSIYGCDQRFSTIEDRNEHKNLCQFEPNLNIRCDNCQKIFLRSELKRHNCIKELTTAINELKDIINGLEAKVNQQMIHMNDSKEILDASPQILTTFEETDGLDDHFVYFSGDNQSAQEVFESEPETNIGLKEPIEQMSSEDNEEEPEKGSYIRYNKQISEESVEFPMYGSQKYKYLAQISRDFQGILPPIDYEFGNSIEVDLKKKNKEKLIDVRQSGDSVDGKQLLVRLRSWSERQ